MQIPAIEQTHGAAAAAAPRPAPKPAQAPPGAGASQMPAPMIQDRTDDLLRAAQALREALGPMFRTQPQFSVDTETRRVRIEIVDESGQVVRQIPSEAVERFARSFDRFLGMLVDEQA